MPEVNFEVTWPDGETARYYSPSTVIREHLQAGDQYNLDDFSRVADSGLNAASERVRQKFGYYCSSAAAELEQIKHKINALREKNIVGNVKINHVD